MARGVPIGVVVEVGVAPLGTEVGAEAVGAEVVVVGAEVGEEVVVAGGPERGGTVEQAARTPAANVTVATSPAIRENLMA